MSATPPLDLERAHLDTPRKIERPSREEAEAAVRVLLRWTGDDPDRDGLLDTPGRVVRAWEDWFNGYNEDPADMLARTFEEVEGYDEMIVLRDIRFESHCEHHVAPIIGKAHVAYIPTNRVVGISKLARVVEVYGKRLQIAPGIPGDHRQAPRRSLTGSVLPVPTCRDRWSGRGLPSCRAGGGRL